MIFEPGRFEFTAERICPGVPAEIAARLREWTGLRWIVAVASSGGGATIDEQDTAQRAKDIARLATHPLVAATLETFPGAEVSEIRHVEPMPEPAPEHDQDSDQPEDDASGFGEGQPMRVLAQMMQKAKAVQDTRLHEGRTWACNLRVKAAAVLSVR